MLMALAAASCGNVRREVPAAPVAVERQDLTAEARRWADSVAAGMDTARLAAQLIMPAVYASDDLWTLRQVKEYADMGIGGIVLLKGTSGQARVLADSMTSASRVAPFVAIDAEWGLNMRLVDAPRFPANGNLSPRVEDQLMYAYGREVARECRQLGINMVLGPVLDVGEGNHFLGVRSFSGDVGRVSDLGLSYGRGLADGNVIAVAKHFPGHGSVRMDSHRGKGVIEGSLQRLDTVDLVPFRNWVDAGMTAVMVGHLAVPAIDSRMLPAAVSPTVIKDLLRDDLGFGGLVLTDALNMLGAEGRGAADAVAADADIIIAPARTADEVDNLVRAVRSGRLTLNGLRGHVRRILFYKYLLRDEAGPHNAETLRIPVTDSLCKSLRD